MWSAVICSTLWKQVKINVSNNWNTINSSPTKEDAMQRVCIANAETYTKIVTNDWETTRYLTVNKKKNIPSTHSIFSDGAIIFPSITWHTLTSFCIHSCMKSSLRKLVGITQCIRTPLLDCTFKLDLFMGKFLNFLIVIQFLHVF